MIVINQIRKTFIGYQQLILLIELFYLAHKYRVADGDLWWDGLTTDPASLTEAWARPR